MAGVDADYFQRAVNDGVSAMEEVEEIHGDYLDSGKVDLERLEQAVIELQVVTAKLTTVAREARNGGV